MFTVKKGPHKPNKKDTIRIKGGHLSIKAAVFTGKQGDFYISYCPALDISGYGETIHEAEEFIQVEMRTFSEDVISMNAIEREKFLISLGFKQERYHKKNFSKAFVDEDGILRDFEEGTLERKVLEVA